ncbi:hypothetical protein BAU15_06620 [Enterococcus sp. JM4C]|uniref:ABC transporter permease n=1 Tax=Candidatus Enterococcus huntleyi TaxID=1857217 RepID=UPI001379CD87|nr:ABC transporter permease [Enterococcus sp. JM4C]KAF1297217.1 hypothetical protein BAU15_06620 [Enterococcus sp. JM4C]
MKTFNNLLKVEFYKLFTTKAVWIVAGLVLFIQPLLAMISARELIHLGLDATPLTHPDLAQAIPPKEYLAFYDILPFGILPMVVLGSLLGATEYKNHQLRTTFLTCGKRTAHFIVKLISIVFSSLLISFVAIYATIAVTHLTLGNIGLPPMALSDITWRHIAYGVCEWTFLTVIAYLLAMICRNALVPLLFLIPQVYGLATLLASKNVWGTYLPVAAGKLLTATPTDSMVHQPVQGLLILSVWTLILVASAHRLFTHKDLGGLY